MVRHIVSPGVHLAVDLDVYYWGLTQQENMFQLIHHTEKKSGAKTASLGSRFEKWYPFRRGSCFTDKQTAAQGELFRLSFFLSA